MKISRKQTIIIAGSVVIVSAALFATSQLVLGDTEKPSYRTVAPYGKSDQDSIKWRRVSPPGQDPVFAYSDAIKDTPISVSQQPLPRSFLKNTDESVAELAKKFNATTKIDAFGTPAYLGTSAKGPQSVILTKNGLLIMIKSQQKVPNQLWAEYIQSLVITKASDG